MIQLDFNRNTIRYTESKTDEVYKFYTKCFFDRITMLFLKCLSLFDKNFEPIPVQLVSPNSAVDLRGESYMTRYTVQRLACIRIIEEINKTRMSVCAEGIEKLIAGKLKGTQSIDLNGLVCETQQEVMTLVSWVNHRLMQALFHGIVSMNFPETQKEQQFFLYSDPQIGNITFNNATVPDKNSIAKLLVKWDTEKKQFCVTVSDFKDESRTHLYDFASLIEQFLEGKYRLNDLKKVPAEYYCYEYQINLGGYFDQDESSSPVSTGTGNLLNGNHIKLSPREDHYIVTAHPDHNEHKAYWQAMVKNQPAQIVCLDTSSSYWPEDKGDMINYGDGVTVSCIQKEGDVRTLELHAGERTHLLKHIAYSEWPDCGLPNAESICKLQVLVEDIHTSEGVHKPIAVHCRAGVGRSGTFIGMRHKRKHPDANLIEVVRELRRQRQAPMVETPMQYAFLSIYNNM